MTDPIEKIRTAVSTGGIPKATLAKRAEVHRNSLSGIDSADWDPRYRTVVKLAKAVDEIKRERA